jgi:hypothetical protein
MLSSNVGLGSTRVEVLGSNEFQLDPELQANFEDVLTEYGSMVGDDLSYNG